jgi:hypothetical protein
VEALWHSSPTPDRSSGWGGVIRVGEDWYVYPPTLGFSGRKVEEIVAQQVKYPDAKSAMFAYALEFGSR